MKTWVLVDNRLGTAKQAKSLAKILGFKFITKKLQYTFWAKLPNFMKFRNFDISNDSAESLAKGTPDVIISAGRRSACVAMRIKKKNPSVRIIQIMNGDIPEKFVDVYLLPNHDRKAGKKYSEKYVFIDGAISFLDKDKLAYIKKTWEGKFKAFKKPWISLLIGGPHRHGSYTRVNAKYMMKLSLKFAEKLGGSLLITTSRRTPEKVAEKIKQIAEESKVQTYFHNANTDYDNPYKGLISISDFFIITGDSVTMISEALETRKPIYIFSMPNMVGEKHESFIKTLVRKKLVKELKENSREYKVSDIAYNLELKNKILDLLKNEDK